MTPGPIAVQFWHRIVAATVQRQELVRSLQRLVDTSLPTVGKNITTTMRIASGALLPPTHALHLLRRTLRQKKTLVFVAAGLTGLAFIFSLLEISVRRELAKQATDAAIGGLAAASTSPQQIEFVDRFVIQPANSTSLEAVKVDAPGMTSPSEATQTFAKSLGSRYLCRDLASTADRYRRIGAPKKRHDLLTIAREHLPDGLSRANVYAHAQQRS